MSQIYHPWNQPVTDRSEDYYRSSYGDGKPQAVAYGNKTNILAVASMDGLIIYSSDNHEKALLRIQTYEYGLISVAFNSDDSLICAGSRLGRLYVWTVSGGFLEPSKTITNKIADIKVGDAIPSLCFDGLGEHIAFASWDKRTYLFNLNRKELVALGEYPQFCTDVSFSPDGSSVLLCTIDKTTHLIDIRHSESAIIENCSSGIFVKGSGSFIAVRDGQLLCAFDGAGKKTKDLARFDNSILELKLNRRRDKLAVLCSRRIFLGELSDRGFNSFAEIGLSRDAEMESSSVSRMRLSWSNDDTNLAAVVGKSAISITRLRSPGKTESNERQWSEAVSIEVASNRILTVHPDAIKLWNAHDFAPIASTEVRSPSRAIFLDDGKEILFTKGGDILHWAPESTNEPALRFRLPVRIERLSINRHLGIIVAVGGQTLFIGNVSSNEEMFQRSVPIFGSALSVAIASGGEWIAVSSRQAPFPPGSVPTRVELFNVKLGQMLTATNVDAANLSGQVHALAFSNDDSALWGTGPGLGLRCWPLRDQEPFGSIVHVCFAEESRPRSSQSSWLHSTGALAIHPSKPVIALGGDHMAKKIFLLNQATLRVYESVLAHVEGVSALAFDISRNRMISAGNEGTVKFWQLDQM